MTEWLLNRVQPEVVELGSHSYRILKARNELPGPGKIIDFNKIRSCSSAVLSGQLSQFIFDSDDMKLTLNELSPIMSLREKYVSIVLPDQAFYLGTMTVPAVTIKAGLQPILEREIQKNSPLPVHEYFVRYEFGKKIGSKIQIHFCCLPKGILADLMATCKESGLVPVSIQPSYVGLSHLARISQKDSRHTSAWIHLGHDAITAGIFSVEGLKQVQVINFGVSNLVGALETVRGINFTEAERLLQEELVLLEEPTSDAQFEVELYQVLEPVFAEILKKLYGVLLLYTNEHPDEVGFARIILSGGGAKIKNIEKLISANLGISTVFLSQQLDETFQNLELPDGESIETLAPVLGNLLLRPWKSDLYDRTMAA